MILIRIPTTDFDPNCNPTPKKYLGGIVWMVSVLISQYTYFIGRKMKGLDLCFKGS